MINCMLPAQRQRLVLVVLLLVVAVHASPRLAPGRLPTPKPTELPNVVPPAPVSAQECPGADGRTQTCTRRCQLRICKALADLYRVSNNASDPWDEERGWQLTETTDCQQLLDLQLTRSGQRQPPNKQQQQPQPPGYCTWNGVTCCDQDLLDKQECWLKHSIKGLSFSNNNLNVSLENAVFIRSLVTLHDCGLTALDFENNNIMGSLTNAWGALKHLQYLNLGTTWAAGRLPDGLGKLTNLTYLNLGNNWFSGTFPSWIPNLKLLRVLNLGSQFGDNGEDSELLGLYGTIPAGIGELKNLRQLVLETNSLSGRLPSTLCSKDNSSLLVLNLRGNKMEGPAKVVENCKGLVQLDISSNQFTGSLPASRSWERLATYRANDNMFMGTWPAAINHARILEYLNLANNQLTGAVPASISLLSSLKEVKLDHNMLAGELLEDLYFLPSLSVLDLSSNQFVGTIPEGIGLAYSLQQLDLSNNTGVTGVVAAQMALLPRLQVVKVQQTSMSCAGIIRPYTLTTNASCTDPAYCTTPTVFGDESELLKHCTQEELLPCFLKFSDYSVPREDSSNSKCKFIMRKSSEQARRDCASQLGDQASSISEGSTDRWLARWEIDPSYYQYQACECLLGFTSVWDASGTVLTCIAEQRNTSQRDIGVAVAVASAAVLAVALVVWLQYTRTRPRWLRERLLQAKRSKGPPKASKPGERVLVTVLVTDVKDFSALTRKHPELMNKAMGGHNNILRKACHTHAGHVMDQEGDSWTIAFHEAEDAVAFSLQVQQALSKKVWTITRHERPGTPDSSTRLPVVVVPSHTTQPSEHSASSSYALMGSGGVTTPPGPSAATAAAGGGARHFGGGGVAYGSQGGNMLGSSRNFGSFSAASDDRASDRASSSTIDPTTGVVFPCHSQECSFTSVPGRQGGDIEVGNALGGSVGAAADDTQPGRDTANSLQCQQQQQFMKGLIGRLTPLSGSSTSKCSNPPSSTPRALPDSPSLELPHADSMLTSQHSSSIATVPSSRGTSRLYSAAGSMIMQMLPRRMRSTMHSSMMPPLGSDNQQDALRLSVRIGIATGWLCYGSSLENCAVKDRAKNYVSDVANGGQVLMDERTFKLVKHSLSALGTVDENGYNDKQLQQLMHAQVVAKMQCGTGCFRDKTHGSFSSSDQLSQRDYDTDALVVHMGGFIAPTGGNSKPLNQFTTSTSDNSTQSADDDDGDAEGLADLPPVSAAAAARAARRRNKRRASMEGRAGSSGKGRVHLQLYSIAAPAMRRQAQHTSELGASSAWCQPVRVKPGWLQVQKNYFQAPGARADDLISYSHQQEAASCRQPLPPVTFVFAEVMGAHSLAHKHHKTELQSLNKAIRRCMLQLTTDLPGGDGYMCRSHEADLRYLVAFESPVNAVQWCLLVSEALMYLDYPQHILNMPGFQEVTDPDTGALLFRGPRLRMGLTEGVPDSVLPDHTGRTNYTGSAVNRAARFMDVAAQPGQVVCELAFAQRCFNAWPAHDAAGGGSSVLPHRQTPWGSAAAADSVSPESIPESAAATDWGDPQVSLMQLMALRSKSETSGHCRPFTGPQGLRSRAAHELWYSQQQLKNEQKSLYRRQMSKRQHAEQPELSPPHSADGPAAAAARGGGTPAGSSNGVDDGWGHVEIHGGVPRGSAFSNKAAVGGGRGSSSSVVGAAPGDSAVLSSPAGSFTNRFHPLTLAGSITPGVPLQRYALASSRQQFGAAHAISCVTEEVTAAHVGSYSFKGSGVFDMVQLQHPVLKRRPFTHEPPRGKGMKLTEASGPVSDLPQVQLLIPVRLLTARQAYAARVAEAAAVACAEQEP